MKHNLGLSKDKGKDFGMILFFLLLFPYVCTVLFHTSISSQETKKYKVENLEKKEVQIQQAAGIETLPLEEYLIMVLAAAMPIEYEAEALQAQSILLRTAVCKELELGNKEGTQVFLTIPQMKQVWGNAFDDNYEVLKQAVIQTSGMVLCIQGKLANVPYFQISAGMTRDGAEALGEEFAYLTSVASKEDIWAEAYLEKREYTLEEINQIFAEIGSMIEITKTDTAGYVLELTGEHGIILGEEFRKKMNLASAHFIIEKNGDQIKITTHGIGHGVGMSQYGANKLAEQGNSEREILEYYFPQAEIQKQ